MAHQPLLAITVWQPWASLIVEGCKPYEFRKWDYRKRQPRLVGQRIAIHAGRRPADPDELRALSARLRRLRGDPRAIALLERAPDAFALSAVLGTAVLGEPQQVAAGTAATALLEGPYPDDAQLWAWPLGDVECFGAPVPARGSPGFWRWPRG